MNYGNRYLKMKKLNMKSKKDEKIEFYKILSIFNIKY